MRILICNIQMSARTGTEIVTRDLALGLKKRGHNVHVLTGYWGPLCDEMSAAAVAVHLDLVSVPRPDVIHVHHMPFARSALERFPDAPAVVVCHDASGTNSAMWQTTQVQAWAGVSEACRARVSNDLGIGIDSVLFLPNSVDLDRAPAPRQDLPIFPRRWLYIGEKQFGNRLEAKFRIAARRMFASVDVVGPFPSSPKIVEDLPAFVKDYDLVLATARCAIECAAMGVGVVVGDPRGIAGFLGVDQWHMWKRHNFGMGCLKDEPRSGVLMRAAWRWNRRDIRKVTEIARRERPLSALLDRLENIYGSIMGKSL